MKKLNRDEIILFVILPLLVLGGYWFSWAEDAEKKVEALLERKETLGPASLIRMETAAANKKLAEAEAKLKSLEEEARKAEASDSLPHRLKTLTALCESCGGQIHSFTQGEPGGDRRYRFGSRHWNLRCEATYANMKNFLARLAADEGNPMVESLSVDIIANGERRRYIWTLLMSL